MPYMNYPESVTTKREGRGTPLDQEGEIALSRVKMPIAYALFATTALAPIATHAQVSVPSAADGAEADAIVVTGIRGSLHGRHRQTGGA